MDLRRNTVMTLRTGIFVTAGLLIVVLIGFFVTQDMRTGIDKSKFQIVTLTTGERFFGKLSGLDDRYVTLSDVYFQQEGSASAGEGEATSVTVTKLSASVAKPEDTLHIDRDKIAHWANLQDDSKIVQAIKQDGNSQ